MPTKVEVIIEEIVDSIGLLRQTVDGGVVVGLPFGTAGDGRDRLKALLRELATAVKEELKEDLRRDARAGRSLF